MEWSNSILIPGDVAEYVAALRSQAGPEIQVHGSPGLIQTLLEHDLIDEYRMWIFPLVIGPGKRFFGDGTAPAALKLVGSKVSKTGVTINTYQRAGDIKLGVVRVRRAHREGDRAAPTPRRALASRALVIKAAHGQVA